jgi:hypothetical protein
MTKAGPVHDWRFRYIRVQRSHWAAQDDAFKPNRRRVPFPLGVKSRALVPEFRAKTESSKSAPNFSVGKMGISNPREGGIPPRDRACVSFYVRAIIRCTDDACH